MRYNVWRTWSVCDRLIIEANSKQEAKEIAWKLPLSDMQLGYIDDSMLITDEDITEIDE